MCAAIEEMRMDSRLEGRLEGVIKTCKRFNMSLQDSVQISRNCAKITCAFCLSESSCDCVVDNWCTSSTPIDDNAIHGNSGKQKAYIICEQLVV